LGTDSESKTLGSDREPFRLGGPSGDPIVTAVAPGHDVF
jgi:hypothetical protein